MFDGSRTLEVANNHSAFVPQAVDVTRPSLEHLLPLLVAALQGIAKLFDNTTRTY
jgi:hypothetical protein